MYDPTLTGYEVTSALRKIAGEVAAGDGAGVLRALLGPPPAFARAAFPGIAGDELRRIMTLIAWAMLAQHTASAIEVERRRRLAKIFPPTTANYLGGGGGG